MIKLELQSPENFKLISATIQQLEKDGFEMIFKTEESTDVHAVKTLTGAKTIFTKRFGKGAEWTEVENFSIKQKEFVNIHEKQSQGRVEREGQSVTITDLTADREDTSSKKEKNVVHDLTTHKGVGTSSKSKTISEKNTDKLNEKQSALPFDMDEIGSFEVEPSETEKEASRIKSETPKTEIAKKLVAQTIVPIKTEDTLGMSEFSKKASELINLSTVIKVIENDVENNNAREVAKNLSKIDKEIDECRKMLNKPLDTAIKSNNLQAKTITEPLQKQVDRIKILISSYETEKERKRLAEIKKVQDAKDEAEKLEKAESDRVARITGSIQKMETDLSAKIEAVRTTEGLNEISTKLGEWIPKKEYYQEFMPKVEELVVSLNEKIKARFGVVKELEKAIKKGDVEKASQALGKLEEVKQQEEVVKQEKQTENELTDFQARQQLISLFSSMGIDDVASYVERAIEMYGSAQIALLKKDEMIVLNQKKSDTLEKESELMDGGMKNQRIDFIFEITDKSKIPLEYLKVDDVAIRAVIKSNRQMLLDDIKGFEIAGVVIKRETKTVLR